MEITFIGFPVEPTEDEKRAFWSEEQSHWRQNMVGLSVRYIDGLDYGFTPRFKEANIPFKRVRRVTGYLSSTARFNDGKRAELRDRVTHGGTEV